MECIKIHCKLHKDAINIRQKVFVEEQKFVNEFDDKDDVSFHFVIYKNGIAAGTARMFTEDGGESFHIGRVAVLPEYRKDGFGSKLVKAALKKASELGAKKPFSRRNAECNISMNHSVFLQAEKYIMMNIALMCIWRNHYD